VLLNFSEPGGFDITPLGGGASGTRRSPPVRVALGAAAPGPGCGRNEARGRGLGMAARTGILGACSPRR